MKLHKDGTVEGTPEEIAEYRLLMKAQHPQLLHSPFPEGSPAEDERTSILKIQEEHFKNRKPHEIPKVTL